MDAPQSPPEASSGSLRLLRKLIVRTRPHLGFTILSVALMMIVIGAELALPKILGETIDALARFMDAPVAENPDHPVLIFALVYLGVACVGLLCRFAGGVARTILIQRLLTDLRLDLHGAIQRLAFRWHDARSPGEILSRATRDVEKIRAFYADVITSGGELLAVTLGSLVLIALVNVWLGLLSTIIVIAVLSMVLHYGQKLRPMWRLTDDSYDEVTHSVQETVAGARVVRAFGRESDEVERFQERTRVFLDAFLRGVNYWAARMPLSNALFNSSIPALLFFGGMMVMDGTITIGALSASIFYLTAISQKLRVLGRLVEATQDAVASTERIYEMLESDVEMIAQGSGRPAPKGAAALRFENVTFIGDRDRTILSGIDFEIEAGSTVAFVGPTGSGKSSLVSLIPRFHDPSSGRVLLGGEDLREYELDSLRRSIALVFQDTFLFSATVAENIALGVPDATMAAVRDAATLAQAIDFIENLPKGFETIVGERGITLSGGQKQRIAIARAYLCDPSVLVMDDATSSLDSRTERSLQNAAREVTDRRTTILIAHRFSTIQHADRIFVLDEGCLVESGTHDELVKASGLYSRLYAGQSVLDSPDSARPDGADSDGADSDGAPPESATSDSSTDLSARVNAT